MTIVFLLMQIVCGAVCAGLFFENVRAGRSTLAGLCFGGYAMAVVLIIVTARRLPG
jgi:hypothetical protein